MTQLTELKVPDIGGNNNVDVIEVFVKPGDRVEQEQSLITLESDKATMDIPAERAGVIKKVLVKVGSKVSAGDVIAQIEAADALAEQPVAAAGPDGLTLLHEGAERGHTRTRPDHDHVATSICR